MEWLQTAAFKDHFVATLFQVILFHCTWKRWLNAWEKMEMQPLSMDIFPRRLELYLGQYVFVCLKCTPDNPKRGGGDGDGDGT